MSRKRKHETRRSRAGKTAASAARARLKGVWAVLVGAAAIVAAIAAVMALVPQWRVGRPNVVVSAVEIHEDFIVGRVFRVEVALKNLGQTNAYDLTGSACMKSSATIPSDLSCPSTPGRASKIDLGPGQERLLSLPADAATSQEMYDAIKSGQMKWFMWGEVRYADADKVAHVTEFCSQYQPLMPRNPAWCSVHNTAR